MKNINLKQMVIKLSPIVFLLAAHMSPTYAAETLGDIANHFNNALCTTIQCGQTKTIAGMTFNNIASGAEAQEKIKQVLGELAQTLVNEQKAQIAPAFIQDTFNSYTYKNDYLTEDDKLRRATLIPQDFDIIRRIISDETNRILDPSQPNSLHADLVNQVINTVPSCLGPLGSDATHVSDFGKLLLAQDASALAINGAGKSTNTLAESLPNTTKCLLEKSNLVKILTDRLQTHKVTVIYPMIRSYVVSVTTQKSP